MRQLVKKAGNKGFGITKLNQAVTTIWKEEFVVEKKKLEPLTEEEEKFSEKVQKLLEHYGDDLIEYHNISHGFIIEKDDLKRKKHFLGEYYEILCSIYGVFQREERINQNQPVYLEKYVDWKHKIIKNEGFCNFISQFDFRNNQVNKVALVTVWFIKKYF